MEFAAELTTVAAVSLTFAAANDAKLAADVAAGLTRPTMLVAADLTPDPNLFRMMFDAVISPLRTPIMSDAPFAVVLYFVSASTLFRVAPVSLSIGPTPMAKDARATLTPPGIDVKPLYTEENTLPNVSPHFTDFSSITDSQFERSTIKGLS